MRIAIIIPCHNEEDYIGQTLTSIVAQTLLPTTVIVVDDQSDDTSSEIVQKFSDSHPWITLVQKKSSEEHLPGSKVIQAFQTGLDHLDTEYDILCKFDADLIFPNDYLESIVSHFKANKQIGMAGGFCYIEKNGEWTLENLTNQDHIRGALKAYRKDCFADIGGLKTAMGWDTVDELLAKYHNWQVITDPTLHVCHLKPTGQSYSQEAKYKQGMAFYTLRYGLLLSFIAATKLALKKRNFWYLKDYITGYFRAKQNRTPYLVTAEEGAFIRKLRWEGIFQKLSL